MIETRQITQVKVWTLIMNPITHNVEYSVAVAWSDDKEKLITWYNSQLTGTYYIDVGYHHLSDNKDYHYRKFFNKGSYLEWYNPINLEILDPWNNGLTWDWINETDLSGMIGERIY